MVWSQYVYEATTGLDTYFSDDDENNQDAPLTIEDWEVQYTDELWMMWGAMQTLLYDAMLTHTCTFTDFVAFCYVEHNVYADLPVAVENEEKLFHIWKSLRRIVNANGLHEEMMRGAGFYHFCAFIQEKI